MSAIVIEQTPYINLANAIVRSVAKDYKRALKKLMSDPNDFMAMKLKEESENFFLSDWYHFLTNVHPNYLMKRIQKEVGYHDRYN